MAGVSVRAHCRFGNLFPTGDTVTDAEGRYDLRFSPGIDSSRSFQGAIVPKGCWIVIALKV